MTRQVRLLKADIGKQPAHLHHCRGCVKPVDAASHRQQALPQTQVGREGRERVLENQLECRPERTPGPSAAPYQVSAALIKDPAGVRPNQTDADLAQRALPAPGLPHQRERVVSHQLQTDSINSLHLAATTAECLADGVEG